MGSKRALVSVVFSFCLFVGFKVLDQLDSRKAVLNAQTAPPKPSGRMGVYHPGSWCDKYWNDAERYFGQSKTAGSTQAVEFMEQKGSANASMFTACVLNADRDYQLNAP